MVRFVYKTEENESKLSKGESEKGNYEKSLEVTKVKWNEVNQDNKFFPIICCISCASATKEWEWVTNPDDGEKYGVCKKCEEKVRTKGIVTFSSS